MKTNDEILQEIKGEFDNAPEMPESLSKERMVAMLKNKEITPKKKIKILPKITAALAMLTVTLVCFAVYDSLPAQLKDVEPSYQEMQDVQSTQKQPVSYAPIENEVEAQALKKASTNAELKKHIQDLLKREKTYVYNFLGSDDEAADGAAVVTAATSAALAKPGDYFDISAEESRENADDISGSVEYGETNVQVEGVDEADIIKNDGKYIYIVADSRLKIVDTSTMTMLYDEGIKVDDKEADDKNETIMSVSDIYVKGDTLVAVCNYSKHNHETVTTGDMVYCYGYDPSSSETVLVVYDISDRSSPKETRRVSQDGRMISTRMNGSVIYTVTTYTVYSEDVEEKYMPSVNGELIGCDCVYIYDDKSTVYTLLTAFDTAKNDDEVSKVTVLGEGVDVYCTNDTLYVGGNSYDSEIEKTNIFAFSLDGTNIAYKASGVVKGCFLNQFSIDEHNDCLRIATTYYDYKKDKDVSNVYIMDKELNLIGKLEDIADDEQVKAVRFMGDTGYVVTFRNTDPLFTLDLSDPTKPAILGEVKLPGYSTYLHPIGNGYMVGIGYDGDEENANLDTVKVSVFDVRDPKNPKESDTFVIKDVQTEVNNDPKAFICNEAKGYIGFPVIHYEYGETVRQVLSYKILKTENGKIVSHEGFTHSNEDYNVYGYGFFRGTYIGEKLYTIDRGSVIEHSLTSGKVLRSCDILGEYEETDGTIRTAHVKGDTGIVVQTTAKPTSAAE